MAKDVIKLRIVIKKAFTLIKYSHMDLYQIDVQRRYHEDRSRDQNTGP